MLVVTAAVAVLFVLGWVSGSFDRFEPLIARTDVGDELVAGFLLLSVGVTVLAVRQARRAEREAALRADADEQIRALVAESPVVSFTWLPREHRYRYVSPQVEVLLGVTVEEHMRDWSAQVHPDDRARVEETSRVADRDGATFLAEYRIIRPDGRVRWIHDESHYYDLDASGRPTLAQGVMFDITERKEAEDRAAAAEERYRTLVERVPAISYAWDSSFDQGSAPALYISPQIEQLLGVSAEAWLEDPMAWSAHAHPDDEARVTEAWSVAADAGAPFSEEYRLRTSAGEWLWVRDEATPIGPGSDGGLLYQGVIIDITERHAAEEDARHAEERWRLLLEHLPLVAYQIAVNDRGEVADRWVAAGVERLFGITPEEWLADVDTWDALIHPDDHAAVLDAWERMKHETGTFDQQYRMVSRDGRTLWVHDRATCTIRDGSRVVEGAFVDITAWRTAEAALEEAEGRFRTLVEQLPAITFIEDAVTGADIYVSPQLETMYGYTPEEWVADPHLWERRLHPDDHDWVVASNAEEDGDGIWSVDYRSFTRDGRMLWVHNEARLIRDPDGAPLYWLGAVYDITERKVAEERVRDAEERYRTLVEQLPVAIYTDAVDDVSTALYISPQYEALTGYTAEQRLLDPDLWVHMLHPDDRDRVLTESDATNRTGEPFDIEYRIVAADGRIVWLHDHAVQVLDAEGRGRWQGVLQDVTDAHLAEDRLADAEQRYRAIVEHIPAAIYLDRPTDALETIYVSPQIADIMGVTPEEWIADPDLWRRLVVPEDREPTLATFLEALEAGENWRAEYRVRTPDGRTVWIHDETTFLTDEEGRPQFVQGVVFDITERKLAEQALRESEQREREAAERLRALDDMKNTFLAAVSHELRSPLTSILGLALTLERAPDIEGPDRDDLLSRLAANAKKLDRLLKDLLDIDRLNRGIVEPQYRVTDVGALARRTVEHLDALVGREVLVQTDPVVIPVDPPKVERIVENLLMNAVRHTESDRRIWLFVGPYEGGVRISVEDDGPGVPAELRSAIFEPFQQGPTRSPHAPGTGIGLSLVARFAELHGGRAWVDEREGGGAAFHVVIPGKVLDHPDTDAEEPAAPPQADTA